MIGLGSDKNIQMQLSNQLNYGNKSSSMILDKCNSLFGNQTTFMEMSMINNLLTVNVFTSVINPFTYDIVQKPTC